MNRAVSYLAASASLIAAALFAVPATATPIYLGDVSVDWAPGNTLAINYNSGPNGFFALGQGYGVTPEMPGYTFWDLLGSGTITADPGRYITRVSVGFTFGAYNNFVNGFSVIEAGATIHGGQYSGVVGSIGGPECNYQIELRCWEITSPSSVHAKGQNFTGGRFAASAGLPGFFTIDASSFSFDLSQHIRIYAGNQGFNFAEGLSVGLSVETALGAPPGGENVSAPGALAVFGLGLLGLGATRRRKAA